jgi:predicted nucleic acid-binding protein
LIVVDTSVVVKWAVEEDGAEAARLLIGGQLFAPDLIMFELGHVLTKKVRRRELDPDSALIAHRHLPLLLQLVPSRPYEGRAFDLAIDVHHSIYDCYFLALAETANIHLVTADEVFVRKARAMDAHSPVRLLGES